MPLREVAEHHDATVEWDGANQTVLVTLDNGDVVPVVFAEVGGYNENGTVWVPASVLIRLFRDFGFTLSRMSFALMGFGFDLHVDPVEPRDPIVRTTDHGQMAVGFIEVMNDTLYNRYPFSYRELEAAEWIIYQLLYMGHSEDAIEMQTFSIRDVVGEMGAIFDIFDQDLDSYETYSLLVEFYYEALAEVAVEWGASSEEIAQMASMNALRMIDAMDYGFDRLFFGGIGSRRYSQNVLLTIPGQSERKIIVTAHYDTIENVPGASDNASGVSLLLESAYRMLGVENYFTIVYAFVGAEEIGLLGAGFYLESLTQAQRDNIVLNINADVLFEGPYFFFGAAAQGFYNQLVDNDITLLIAEIAYELNATFGTDLISAQELARMPSDQLVFLMGGHTVVSLAGLSVRGATDYDNYPFMAVLWLDDATFGGTILHTPMDDVHYINTVWPNKIGDAMWTFSLFLEALLAANFE